jgi:hypothetical protein
MDARIRTIVILERPVRFRPSPAGLRLQNAAVPVGGMDLDDLLQRYFGASDLSEASPAVREAGVDRLVVDLGLETDRPRRFALWSLLYMLGQAPELDAVFDQETDREAARNLMDLLANAEQE